MFFFVLERKKKRKSAEKTDSKLRPNYFIAVQITNVDVSVLQNLLYRCDNFYVNELIVTLRMQHNVAVIMFAVTFQACRIIYPLLYAA